MNDEVKLLREAVRLLTLIAVKMGVEIVAKPIKSAGSVASVITRVDGTVTINENAGDVPSQLERLVVKAGPMRRIRTVERIKNG
jgi:hypothetical protein